MSQKPILTTLHRFDGKYGAYPDSPLTLGQDGCFYGVTSSGGIGNQHGYGPGTVFKMTAKGQFTTLLLFDGSNGLYPSGALVAGKDGAFYGTTYSGGSEGFGTVFRITSDGQFTTLHNLTGTEGGHPRATLLLAPDGSFYGTTYQWGAGDGGTVFHMTVDGALTTLHTFSSSTGKTSPAGLTTGPDGALYGTTEQGNGVGIVYRITPSGAFSILHTFTGSDAREAESGLTLGPDGALYGMTDRGGIDNNGVAYKITSSGRFTLLHKFSDDGHGAKPFAALTLGADGNFYGTTIYGGTDNRGTVFQMTPAGQVTTVYKFHTNFDGYELDAGIIFGPEGALYGVASGGGANGYGTIFKLTLPQ